MNIGQSSSFKKIKWCGAAKHNTHGKGKKRLTLQQGRPKRPPRRARCGPHARNRPYNHGIVASATTDIDRDKDGSGRAKSKLRGAENQVPMAAEQASVMARSCAIHMGETFVN
jgi:hypothetical protein